MKHYSAYRNVRVLAAILSFTVAVALPIIASAGIILPNTTPIVTLVLVIDDNGARIYTPNSYAIYAVDSTADGNGGIVSFAVNYTGATAVGNHNTTGAVQGYYDDGTGGGAPSGNDDEIGFTSIRNSSLSGRLNSPNLTASQDTIGFAEGSEVKFVYGLGQSSGNLAQWAAPGSASDIPPTGLDTSANTGGPHTILQNYGVDLSPDNYPELSNATSALLLTTGSYATGAPPAFFTSGGNPNGDAVNLWTSNGSTTTEAAAIQLETVEQPFTEGAVPEPTGTILLALGSGVLLLRRRSLGRSWRTVGQI